MMNIDIFNTVVNAINKGDKSVVEKLINDYPYVLSTTDEYGWSVLHHAASKGDAEIGELIINSEICLEIRDNGGDTPLQYAASERNDVASLLIKAGVDVNTRDNKGDTPLLRLAGEADDMDDAWLVTELLQAGADPNIRNNSGETAEYIAIINNNPGMASLIRQSHPK
jgi:26S proteasome non-ATPase regulatory subunit 10